MYKLSRHHQRKRWKIDQQVPKLLQTDFLLYNPASVAFTHTYLHPIYHAPNYMWDTKTFWFDIALILGIFAVGNILFGHFEEHRPKWRRLLKVVIILSLALCLSYFRLRWVTYVILVIFGVGAGYIHLVWLPRNGINGWTGEPKQKYFELLGVEQSPNQTNSDDAEQYDA